MDGPLSVQIPVQLLLELEPNLLVQNVIELEFELSRSIPAIFIVFILSLLKTKISTNNFLHYTVVSQYNNALGE